MKYEVMTEEEMIAEECGAAITLTAVMAVLATAVLAVIVYKLFLSQQGSANIPGGWKFAWK